MNVKKKIESGEALYNSLNSFLVPCQKTSLFINDYNSTVVKKREPLFFEGVR